MRRIAYSTVQTGTRCPGKLACRAASQAHRSTLPATNPSQHSTAHGGQARLDRVRVVLVRTSLPANIGAAARAMHTMGLGRLTLVAPARFPADDATALDASHRLAHFLVERAAAQRESELDIALTQEELASLVTSSRESVVRALSALRTRGLIETGRRQITIRDLEGLRAFAG